MAQDKDLKTPNVPPLRFPGFTDEWKKNKVGELFKISVAGDIDKAAVYPNQSEQNPYPVISNSLENDGIYGYTSSYKCEEGTITVTGRGTLGIAKARNYKYFPIVRLLSLRPNDSIDYGFGQYAINKIHFFFEITGVPQLTAPQLSTYVIRYPSLTEQKKIAHLFSLIDKRIAAQNKIIDNLQSLIKGLATGLTLQGETNTHISDCLECHTSTLQESNLHESGKYPAYGASGIAGYLDEYTCDEDSILIIKDGSGVGTVSHVSGKYSVIGTMNYLTAKPGYSLNYLYFCLMSFNFEPFKTGMAIPHIYFKDYGRAKIWCPSLESQNDIAKILSAIDGKLQIEFAILDSLHKKRSYLLNNMFI